MLDFGGSQMGWFYRYLFGQILAKALPFRGAHITFLVVPMCTQAAPIPKCLGDFSSPGDNSRPLCFQATKAVPGSALNSLDCLDTYS